MTQVQVSGTSNRERARQRYDELRSILETPENIGKLVSIDLTTGNYAVGDDYDMEAPRILRERNPEANIFTLRIGYNVVYALGGVLERTTS